MGGYASVAWPMAMTEIFKATGEPLESVRIFLDSRHGRHFADAVQDTLLVHPDMHQAVTLAIEKWMGWKIGRTTQRTHGIPNGLPYLTGLCDPKRNFSRLQLIRRLLLISLHCLLQF